MSCLFPEPPPEGSAWRAEASTSSTLSETASLNIGAHRGLAKANQRWQGKEKPPPEQQRPRVSEEGLGNTRSTYATSPAEDDTRVDAQGQPPEPQDPEIQDPKAQPNSGTTLEQELQQLQAQLQRVQQERDRMAAAFVANQQAIQASAQAAKN